MSTIELRRQAKSMIDGVPARDLQLVREFLTFVASRETNAATRELLSIRRFGKSFVRGVRDINAKRSKLWREVRKDLQLGRVQETEAS